METSILLTIKKMLGVPVDSTEFDTDIIVNINSTLMTLRQLGIGPAVPFAIDGPDALWTDFLGIDEDKEAVKTYIYLVVRLAFDPPTTSFLLDAVKQQIEELAWRLMVIADPATPT